jgi:hypothetical protein
VFEIKMDDLGVKSGMENDANADKEEYSTMRSAYRI